MRLRQERDVIRQIVVANDDPARGRHDLDRRRAVANEPGSARQSIPASDIGKDDVDIWTGLQDGDRVAGIGRRDDLGARAFDRLVESSRSTNSSSTIKITGAKRNHPTAARAKRSAKLWFGFLSGLPRRTDTPPDRPTLATASATGGERELS
jgi:hypothetical protein